MSLSLRLFFFFCSDSICVLKRAVLPLQVNYQTELAQHQEWKYQTVWLHCSLWCAFFPLFLSAGLLSSLSAEKNFAFLSLAWIFMLIQTHPSDWCTGLSEDSTQAPEAEHLKGSPWQESHFSKNLLYAKRGSPQKAKEPKRTNTQKTKLVGIYETHFLFSSSVLFFSKILERRLLGSLFWATCWIRYVISAGFSGQCLDMFASFGTGDGSIGGPTPQRPPQNFIISQENRISVK